MHHIHWNMCGIARAEALRGLMYPLFRVSRNHVNDFFHVRVAMKFVRFARRHCHAHQQQVFRLGQAFPTDPLVRPPRQFLHLHIILRNKSQHIGHGYLPSSTFGVPYK